jgi:hypothetical protein
MEEPPGGIEDHDGERGAIPHVTGVTSTFAVAGRA